MTLLSPSWLQNLSYSALQDRLIAMAALRPGIVELGDLLVSTRALGANMSVDIAPGTVVVKGTDVVNQGNYVCRSSALENRTIAAAPGAGQSRIDAVYARVRDGQASGGADNDWILAVQTGVAATTGSQVAPALPTSSVELARVTVASGTASITAFLISDRRAEALRRTSIDRVGLSSVTPVFSVLTEVTTVTTRTHAYPVEVSAVITGTMRPSTGQSNMVVSVRLDISLDSGVTWATQMDTEQTAQNSLTPASICATEYRSGTASGSVKVRAMMKREGGSGTVSNVSMVVTTAPRNS